MENGPGQSTVSQYDVPEPLVQLGGANGEVRQCVLSIGGGVATAKLRFSPVIARFRGWEMRELISNDFPVCLWPSFQLQPK